MPRRQTVAVFFALTMFLMPSVQAMFLPNPFHDAPSDRDSVEEGPYWRELIGVDMPLTDYSFISEIICTRGGDLLVIGTDAIYHGHTEEGYLDYSKHGYISKMTEDGIIAWEHLIGDDLEFYDCEEIGEDQYLVLGRDIEIENKSRAVLLAFDGDGAVLWKNTINSETDYSAFSMVQDDDGNVYLAGHTDTELGFDGLLMKLDAEGNLLWKRAYDDGEHEMFTKIAMTNDGDLVLMGTKKWLEFLPSTIPLYSQALVVSYDAQGELRWGVSRGADIDYTVATDIEIGSNGMIAITGCVSIKREKHDILSLLVDPDGNVIECNSYPGLFKYDDYGYDIKEIKGGRFVVFGESYDMVTSQEDPALWWYVGNTFYSIIGESGEAEFISQFYGDGPSKSLFKYSLCSTIMDKKGRIFLVVTLWGEYEVFALGVIGDSMLIINRVASHEFPH